MAEGERDWTMCAAMAPSKDDYFEMERGRYDPVHPRTPAAQSLSVDRSATERLDATTGAKQGKAAIHGEPRLVGFTYAVG